MSCRSSLPSLATALCFGVLACAGGGDDPTTTEATGGDDAARSAGFTAIVEPSDFHGIHGLTVTPDGRLLAGSVVGQAIYEIDVDSGEVTELIGPPEGSADDLEVGPDGTLAWTSFLTGKVHARALDGGEIRVLAEGLPAANSIAWTDDGRLFVTQVFGGDALWEIDPAGEQPPRQIATDLGGLNGFDIGPDGKIYGPIWFGERLVRVDPESGEMETVAGGFAVPAAANFDSAGNLWALDTQRGQVVLVDREGGGKTVVATLRPSLDNLAFSPDDRLFVSNMADNGIYEVDTESGDVRTLVEGSLSVPAGIALWEGSDGGEIHVADTFAYRVVDPATGDVREVRRMFGQSLEELDYPIWASVDDDHVLLTSWTSSTVQVVDRASGESLEMLHGFAAPVAAVELADGRIAVAEIGGALLLVDAADREVRTPLVEDLAAPVGMVHADSTGSSVYVTEVGSGTLTRYDLSSGERSVVASGLAQPEGLAVRADGSVIVAEVGARRLIAIDPADGSISVLAEELPVGLPAPVGVPPAFVPTGVAVAGDGTVYFSSDLDNAIYRVDS